MSVYSSPTPAEIRAARKKLGLTQTEAACLVYGALRTWQHWESGERAMPAALWELWRYKARIIDEIERLPLPEAAT